MKIYDLRVQDMAEPLGIGARRPIFSYSLRAEENGEYQSAVRLLAASSEALLSGDAGDVWDSGKMAQTRNFAIPYGGNALCSRQKVYWKVKVWDQSGKESPWSGISCFETGLLGESDWKGGWIGQGDEYRGDKSRAPLFRLEFVAKGISEAVSARLYISGLGMFAASLNGIRLSDTLYDPGESDATRTVYYVTYDIKEYLREGRNALGIVLGNGQYTGYAVDSVMADSDGKESPKHRYQKNDSRFIKPGICGDKKLIAQAELTLRDGTVKTLAVSDEEAVWRDGPTVFQNWYGGEDYDALEEITGWDEPGGGTEGWKRAKFMKAPGGRLTAREFPAIGILESRPAKSVTRLKNGRLLVDMGSNAAGIPEIRLSGTKTADRGVWIRMYPAEVVKEDGSGVDQASCTQSCNRRFHCAIVDSYRMKGSGLENWRPSFCYQGFRYLEVEGFPGEAGTMNFIRHTVRTLNEKNGRFETSDPVLNEINRITERSIESNMFGAFTDCPQIEKLGWIETSHLMFNSVASGYEIRAWMKKIIHDIADSQIDGEQAEISGNEPEGYVPAIIPEYYRIGGLCLDPNWSGACVFTPWEYYRYYGDLSVLREAYPVMTRYLGYLAGQTKGGLLEGYAQMGEWGEYGEHTPTVLVATCAYYRMLRIVSETAGLLGIPEDQNRYRLLAEETSEAFHARPDLYEPGERRYGTGSQASYGCVLYSGIAREEERQFAALRLAEAVGRNGYHLTSGEVGLKQVFCALAEYGRSDVVYRMVMNQTAPSYRVFVDAGLTTLPEYWNYEEEWRGMVRSRNHAMMGHVKEWLIRYVLGIRPLKTAWEETAVEPYPAGGLTWIKGTVICPFGEITAEYDGRDGRKRLRVIIPPGVTARVGIAGETGMAAPVTVGSGEYEWRPGSGLLNARGSLRSS